ncbi:hypothetical protein B0O99DRAFT_9013 [Bisporella sp. PMI_857]|nr:hypothetical protein B0O99DRAFT_9013 [Bisporella sp. PMI_857]
MVESAMDERHSDSINEMPFNSTTAATDLSKINNISSMPSLAVRNSVSLRPLSGPRRNRVETSALTDMELRKQDALLKFITGDEQIKGWLASACVWYAGYLRRQFCSHWHLLAPTLVNIEEGSTAPASGDHVVLYEFVFAIAKLLKTRRNLALVEIVDDLENRGVLKEQGDGERAASNQIVFAAWGWLSMLYEAVTHPKPDKLEVTKTSTSTSGYRNTLVTRKYTSFKQSFEHIDIPFYSLLRHFGDLIPDPRTSWRSLGDQENDVVYAKLVCFAALQQSTGVNIEWVSSLALHLELDSGNNTLKLFRYPSFCRIMIVEGSSNISTRLFKDHAERNCEDVTVSNSSADGFFYEVLMSYRLIFGQDERSWKAFSRTMPTWEDDQSSSECTATLNDPLLQVLCGKSSTAGEGRAFYEEIDANEPSTYYNARNDFPFLGNRLVELQHFVKQHQPQSISLLPRGVRGVGTRWNRQIVLFFASLLSLLFLISISLQIWQAMLSRQQIDLTKEQLLQISGVQGRK